MKKFTRKAKVLTSLVIIAVLLVAIAVTVQIKHSRKCHDIIGDGYAMGTDPKPVVIGNTCDL